MKKMSRRKNDNQNIHDEIAHKKKKKKKKKPKKKMGKHRVKKNY